MRRVRDPATVLAPGRLRGLLRRHRTTRSALAVTCASATVAASLLLPISAGGAGAESIVGMRQRAAAIAAAIDSTQARLGVLAEQYDQASGRVAALGAAMTTDTTALAHASAQVGHDAAALRRQAIAAYVSGASNSVTALLSGNAATAATSQTYLEAFSNGLTSTITALTDAQHRLHVRHQALQRVRAVDLLVEQALASSKRAASVLETQLSSELSQVNGQIAAAVAAAEAAAAARAAAARAAAAAAAAAARQAAAEVAAARAAAVAVEEAKARRRAAARAAATHLAVPRSAPDGRAHLVRAAASPAAARAAAAAAPAAASAAPASSQARTAAQPSAGSTAGLAAVRAAETQLGVPYVWAGASPGGGFDCSGLTMWAWSQAGVSLPHSAAEQYAVVPHVSLSDLQPGDLVFYGSGGYIYHVIMYVGSGPYGSDTAIQAIDTGTVIQFTPVWSGAVGAGRP